MSDIDEMRDEAFLFAVARSPSLSVPLTAAEEAAIKAWTAGRASAEEQELALRAVKTNLAAKELVLSERLMLAAAAGPDVPPRVSRSILASVAPVPRRWFGLSGIGGWQIASVSGIAVAAILALVVLRGGDDSGGRFQVAALSDRSILESGTGSVTRGIPGQTSTTPPVVPVIPALEFAEVDIPSSLLLGVFRQNPPSSDTRIAEAVTQAAYRLRPEAIPTLFFDPEVGMAARSGTLGEMATLRIYDLALPANAPLRRQIPAASGKPALFISLSP